MRLRAAITQADSQATRRRTIAGAVALALTGALAVSMTSLAARPTATSLLLAAVDLGRDAMAGAPPAATLERRARTQAETAARERAARAATEAAETAARIATEQAQAAARRTAEDRTAAERAAEAKMTSQQQHVQAETRAALEAQRAAEARAAAEAGARAAAEARAAAAEQAVAEARAAAERRVREQAVQAAAARTTTPRPAEGSRLAIPPTPDREIAFAPLAGDALDPALGLPTAGGIGRSSTAMPGGDARPVAGADPGALIAPLAQRLRSVEAALAALDKQPGTAPPVAASDVPAAVAVGSPSARQIVAAATAVGPAGAGAAGAGPRGATSPGAPGSGPATGSAAGASADAPVPPCVRDVDIASRTVLIPFETGSITVTPVHLELLRRFATILKSCPEVALEVSGHTDAKGAQESNFGLSWRRAEAVIAALANLGVATGKLTAVGYGPRRPVSRTSPTDNPIDRRVEIAVR